MITLHDIRHGEVCISPFHVKAVVPAGGTNIVYMNGMARLVVTDDYDLITGEIEAQINAYNSLINKKFGM